jgi:hypothetical protein
MMGITREERRSIQYKAPILDAWKEGLKGILKLVR